MSSPPTVYFIDDSATVREVIKIAFRRENIDVVTYHDAGTALAEMEKSRPDIVITDVVMPDRDGYEVCQYIKTHPNLANTPVILMSGVVNRAVAEKAFAVKADELLRKPFQPQDLMARVKQLLKHSSVPPSRNEETANAAAVLGGIFNVDAPMPPRPALTTSPLARAAVVNAATNVGPAAVSSAPLSVGGKRSVEGDCASVPSANAASSSSSFITPPAAQAPAAPAAIRPAGPTIIPQNKVANGSEVIKLKVEVRRLEGLVKKLQIELQAEREYCRALEEHVKTLRELE